MGEQKKTRSVSPKPRSRSPKGGVGLGGKSSHHGSLGGSSGHGKKDRSRSPKGRISSGGSKSPDKKTSKSVMPHFSVPFLSLTVDDAIKSLPMSSVKAHQDDAAFEEAVKRCIPSEFVLVASQDDVSQSQEDFYAMDHYKLPLPEGKRRWRDSEQAGSVATCAFLQMMYENPKALVANDNTGANKSWSTLEVLEELQRRIKKCSKIDANPTISSSRPLGPPGLKSGMYAPYYVVPPGYTGTRRALLIGCVTGEDEAKPLKGALNDSYNVRQFLITHCGFEPANIVMLEDSYKAPAKRQPTKQNILDSFATMIKQSKPKDCNFIQFSGHGCRTDTNLSILPSDYKENGNIMDDEILNELIKAMPSGVYTTLLVDCCYSGTVGELPYILKSAATKQEIEKRANFDDVAPLSSTTSSHARRAMAGRASTQRIEYFYDLNTRQESKQKEAKGGEEYEQWKQARKLKRNWMHFEPTKLYEFVSTVSNSTAEKMDQGLHAVTDGAKGAAVLVVDASKGAVKYTSDASKGAAKFTTDGAKGAAKLTTDGANFCGHLATDGAKGAANLFGKVTGTKTTKKKPVRKVPSDTL